MCFGGPPPSLQSMPCPRDWHSPQSGKEQSLSCYYPALQLSLHPGDAAACCQTPQVDATQMPARPGYESAWTGVQQPLLDNRSCLAGCSSSQAVPVPNPLQVGRQVAGSSARLSLLPLCTSALGMARPQHGTHFPPPCSALLLRSQAMAQRHPAGATPNLDLTCWRGVGPACCPLLSPATSMFHQAGQSIPPGRACPCWAI